ncbi:MAG: protoporphyrinogen oxidase [Pirellulaceae bacterium]|nr:protoporphyrinogen oxidase [Pirellulaceae bacterium]
MNSRLHNGSADGPGPAKRIAIIGGGITGLSAAYHLLKGNRQLDVTIYETGSRVGGVIQTEQQDGVLLEYAADNFLTSPPDAVNLCRELRMDDQLLVTREQPNGALVVRRQQLFPIPAGFAVMAPGQWWPFLCSPILSPWGKIRAACEYFVRQDRSLADESLQTFVVRRFGQQMYERLVQPLVSSIYTADPTRLSVAATMARFKEMEQRHGSLLRAMFSQNDTQTQTKKERSGGARYAMFNTLKRGMGSLIDRLVSALPERAIRLEAPIRRLLLSEDGVWKLQVGGYAAEWVTADAVIVATPASVTANLMENLAPDVATCYRQTSYASCAIIHLVYKRSQIGHPLNAMGLVVPLCEKKRVLSCSFTSEKYPGRTPEGTVLLRAFVGGACQSHLLNRDDAELIRMVTEDLNPWLRITGEPMTAHVMRRPNAMPQYNVGHLTRVAKIEQNLERFPSLVLAGSSLYGAGIPACIRSGQHAAEKTIA